MECGKCTLCCKLLYIFDTKSKAGIYCKHCTENRGCKVHESELPDECKGYQCAYSQMSNIPITLRPDKCGVIFEKATEDIFIGLTEKGFVVTDGLKGQIDAFLKQGFSVFLSIIGGVPLIFPTKENTGKAIFSDIKALLIKRNGSSSLCNRLG